jgi:hypothetical protein
MAARKLNEIDRHITETRKHVDVQREVVRKLNGSGHIEDATLAQGISKSARNEPEDIGGAQALSAPGGGHGERQARQQFLGTSQVLDPAARASPW